MNTFKPILLLFAIAFAMWSKGQTITVVSDDSWKCTPSNPGVSWNQYSFNDASWGNSTFSYWSNFCPASGAFDYCSTCSQATGTTMWYTPTRNGAGITTTPPTDANANRPVYFRKHIYLPTADITSLSLSLKIDDGGYFYVNGFQCNSSSAGSGTGYQPTTDADKAVIISHLHCGDNVIAIKAYNDDGTGVVSNSGTSQCFWVNFSMNLTFGCAAGLSCSSPNIIPKINASNTSDLTCSQIFDNGTGVGIGSTTPTYYTTNASGANNARFLVDMSSLGGDAGFMIKAGNNYSSTYWPSMGLALTNAASKTILGSSMVGRITSNASGSEAMDLYFSTKPSASAIVERMTIKSDGNIGIGTQTPGALLDLRNINTNNSSALNINHTATVAGGSGYGVYSTISGTGNTNNTGGFFMPCLVLAITMEYLGWL